MVTQRPRTKFTYEDYRHTPEDMRCEVLDGELIMAPAPRIAHQRTQRRVGRPIDIFVEEHGLGEVFYSPTDVVLSDTDIVQPDLLFVSQERAHIITEDNIWGAPDMVIEILSPSTAGRDRTIKRILYARHGVKEYWQVDTDAKTIAVLMLGDDDYEVASVYGEGQILTSPVLQGFALNLGEVF